MERVENTFSLMLKTWPFLLLRFIIVLVLLLPFIPLYKMGIDLCLRWFGDVWIAKVSYCYVLLAMWYIYMSAIRKYVLYMLKAAQMASIAKYLDEEQSYCSILTGFVTTVQKVGSTHLMFLLNCLIEGTIDKFIGPKLKDIPVIEGLSDTFLGRFAGKALSIIGNHIDEAVLCYGYIVDDVGLVRSVIEGLALYMTKWKDVAIGAAKVVVGLMAFKLVVYVVCAYGLITVLVHDGFYAMTVCLLIMCIVLYGLYFALYEPYLAVVVLQKYIEAAVEEDLSDEDIEQVDERIRSMLRDRDWKDLIRRERNQTGNELLTRLFGVEPEVVEKVVEEVVEDSTTE